MQTYSKKTAENWDYFADSTEQGFNAEYFPKLLQGRNLPGNGRILDIGCGTGDFALALAKNGYGVLGIDSCEPMIAVFKNKAAGISGLQVEQADFTTFSTSEKFNGITAFCVMQFILEAEQVIDFFRKAHSLLSDNGVFLLYVYNTLALWNPAGWSANNTREFEGGFARLEISFQPVDNIKGVVRASDYRVLSLNNKYSIDYYTRQIRFYTLSEYKMMLRLAGFSEVKVDVDPQCAMPGMMNGGMKLYISATK